MAKKVIGQIKLHIPAGKATPAPPAAAIATVSEESNTGPRASTPLTPAACNQRGHSSLR